ncbi:MAG: hypothetical protein H6977_14795 [Gammaproteobacteria bacterium]|nr:hypothetical protein [Gammaproteobacteria bacterium]
MFPSVRYLGLAAAFGLAGLLPVSAAAAVATSTVTITFDEPYVSTLEDIIQTNPYTGLGATFASGSGTKKAVIKTPDDFNNYTLATGEDPNNQLLHLDSNPPDVLVQLAEATMNFSFDYRRPTDIGDIDVSIYSAGNLVHAFATINWELADGWVNFAYDGAFGAVDEIRLQGNSKYVIDNLSFEVTAVPLPAPVVLLGSALVLLRGRRRALRTAH